jgi:hypothetical protein
MASPGAGADAAPDSMSWIARLVAADARAVAQLRVVRDLALPDWCIAAGFLRDRAWDALHGLAPRRERNDVDVLFFDPSDAGRAREADAEARLARAFPDAAWEVRNQARMHVAKGLPPHRDTAHAMTFWLETPTAVGIRLEADDTLAIVAPFGVDDLLGLACRPTPWGAARRGDYDARIAAKRWRAHWPGLRFEEPRPRAELPAPGWCRTDQRVGTGFSPL